MGKVRERGNSPRPKNRKSKIMGLVIEPSGGGVKRTGSRIRQLLENNLLHHTEKKEEKKEGKKDTEHVREAQGKRAKRQGLTERGRRKRLG